MKNTPVYAAKKQTFIELSNFDLSAYILKSVVQSLYKIRGWLRIFFTSRQSNLG